MDKKFIVWSTISLFVLTLALASCERGEKDDDERQEEKTTSPSSTSGTGSIAPAPSGGETRPGDSYGQTPPAGK